MVKSQYTAAERKAYVTGKAYRLGRDGRKIRFKSEKNRESFRAGYRAAKSERYEKFSDKKSK